jgi:hypothetical protein
MTNRAMETLFVFVVEAIAVLILFVVVGLAMRHSEFRYAMQYGVSADHVDIVDMPHDCNFNTVPYGEKWCHYERAVSVNHDDRGAKTWVVVVWNKVQD